MSASTATCTRLDFIENCGTVARSLKTKNIAEAQKSLSKLHTDVRTQAFAKNHLYLQKHGLHEKDQPGLYDRLKGTGTCVLSDTARLWLAYPLITSIGGLLAVQQVYYHPFSSLLLAGAVTLIDLVLD